MYLLSFTTGGVKIAQQENDGHCAGKRFFPMLRFSMHKQRKKSIFSSFTFFFYYYYFFKAEISCPLTLRTKRIQSITIYLKKEKKCLYIMYSQQTTFVIKKEKKTRNQVAYSSTLFSLVYLHSTRGFGWIIMN